MTKLNVVYLTIEDVSSGLFFSQVLQPIIQMAQIDCQRKFNLIIINRPWKYLEHRKTLEVIRKSILNHKNIILKYIPLLPPLRNITRSKFLSQLVTTFIGLLFLIFVDKKNCVYHSRGYWPCAAGILINLNPMIFEPRSLWNHENIAMGTIIKGSAAELYWKNLEKNCVNLSRKIISINKQMANYFLTKYKFSLKSEIIPISFSKKNFSFNLIKRKKIRKKLFLNNKKVFVFSGSFGMNNIGIKSIIKTITILKKNLKNSHFLFLTPKFEALSVQYLVQKIGLNDSEFTSIHPSYDEISNYLSASDFGYHSLPLQPDSFTRMGTKIVEYLAVGLPVIVNKNLGAAANIINDQNFGFVIDDNIKNEKITSNLKKISKINRDTIIIFANQEYELLSVAKKYINVYSELDLIKN